MQGLWSSQSWHLIFSEKLLAWTNFNTFFKRYLMWTHLHEIIL